MQQMEEEMTGQKDALEGALVEAGISLLWQIPSHHPPQGGLIQNLVEDSQVFALLPAEALGFWEDSTATAILGCHLSLKVQGKEKPRDMGREVEEDGRPPRSTTAWEVPRET